MERQILTILGPQTCVPNDPLRAARRLDCRTIVMSPQQLDGCGDTELVDRFEQVSLRRVEAIVRRAREIHATDPIHAVTGYDDEVMPIVARVAEELGLPSHPVGAAVAARDKPTMKERFEAAGLPIAPWHLARDEDDAVAWADGGGYPVVVKPLRGGASQGVIRADDEAALRRAYRHLRRIARDYGMDQGGRPVATQLVERYLHGDEVSVEVVVMGGRAHAVVVFGKPQPLEGPFFEETFYVTPSGLPPDTEEEVRDLAERSALALGLTDGPAHCEIRLTDDGLRVIETAARLIGASCARAASEVLGEDLHDVLLRIALRDPVKVPHRRQDAPATGAMMYPIEAEGRIRSLTGLDEAAATPGVSGVTFTVGPGDVLVPFPEQSCYIGMLEATGSDTREVQRILGVAASKVHMDLGPVGCDVWVREVADEDGRYRPPGDYGIEVLEGAEALAAGERVAELLAGVMFDELPAAEAVERAACAIEVERTRYGSQAEPLWIVAPGGGVLLGFTAGGEAFIACGGVLPDLRVGGLGEALFRTLLAALHERGRTRLNADLDPRLPLLPKVMGKLGFQPPALGETAGEAGCCAPGTCA